MAPRTIESLTSSCTFRRTTLRGSSGPPPGAASSPTPPSTAATARCTQRPPCLASSTDLRTPPLRLHHVLPPVLGFLHRPENPKLPRFVSTTSFRPAAAGHRHRHPLDCRHGRALFYDYGSRDSSGVLGCYVVWDPVTGERHKLPGMPPAEALIHATVFCAAGGGCDHRGCSGGPFIVAFAGLETVYETTYDDDEDDEEDDDDEDENENEDRRLPLLDARASFYASDIGEWSMHINVHLDEGRYELDEQRPAALVGDSLYYLCWPGILRYRYGLLRGMDIRGMISAGIREGDVLSMMELPRGENHGIGKNTDVVVMEAEGGGLGLAYLCPKIRTNLYLLARETEGTVGDDGRWVQRRVIDLKTLLPVGNDPKWKPCLKGVSQEANVIFVSTEDGIFSIDLGGSSLQTRKVCKEGVVHGGMHPFLSFYTEATFRLQISWNG